MDGCTTDLSEKAFFKNFSGLKSHLHRAHNTAVTGLHATSGRRQTFENKGYLLFKSVHAQELMKYLEHESSLILVRLSSNQMEYGFKK